MVALGLLSGCGEGSEGTGSGGGGAGPAAASGCLSSAQVREQVNSIAEGAEGSTAEVEAKQAEIQAVEAEAC